MYYNNNIIIIPSMHLHTITYNYDCVKYVIGSGICTPSFSQTEDFFCKLDSNACFSSAVPWNTE